MASPGAFRFFKTASEEEHEHAILFMTYMNKRGGNIKLSEIENPKMSYGSLKEAMIEALNMEKDVNVVSLVE